MEMQKWNFRGGSKFAFSGEAMEQKPKAKIERKKKSILFTFEHA